jgi:peptide deformylase
VAILKILTVEDPALRKKANQVVKITKRQRILVKDMLETMYNANGVGLAAPQVGISDRLVVIDVGDGPLVLFNPVVTLCEGENKDVEGCLSIPGRNEYIIRAQKVMVSYINLEGKKVTVTGEGLLARALQHEIDHLDGILFIDYLENSSNPDSK